MVGKLRVMGQLAAAGSCAVIVSAASIAFALDGKTMPASGCTFDGPLVNTGITPAWGFTYTGGITVSSGGTARFGCPIVRDRMVGTSGLEQLKVHVFDQDSGKQVFCTATSTTNNGTQVQQVGPLGSGVAWSANYKQLTFALNQSQDWGYYHVECGVEAGFNMGIQALSWTEYDGF